MTVAKPERMRTGLPIVDAPRALPAAAASLHGALLHAAKVRVLQAKRLARWMLERERFAAPARFDAPLAHEVYRRAIPIAREDDAADARLEAGKRVNLALAAHAFDGLLLEPGRPLSFWRVLGRLSAARGYKMGLEVSAGCLVPALGGGVCLLANGLFELAARAGLKIAERHGHTMEAVPPRAGELWGLDATVLWPYVDLRFEAREPVRLGVRVEGDSLLLTASAARPGAHRVELTAEDERIELAPGGPLRIGSVRRRLFDARGALLEDAVIAENRRRMLTREALGRTCLSCGESSCHRRVTPRENELAR